MKTKKYSDSTEFKYLPFTIVQVNFVITYMRACTYSNNILIFIIILENATALGEQRQPHAVLRHVQNVQLFPNLTFELQ